MNVSYLSECRKPTKQNNDAHFTVCNGELQQYTLRCSSFHHTVSLCVNEVGLPTKKSKVLRFQICCTRTKYLSEIYKNRTTKVGAAKLFSVNSSRT